MKLTLTLRYTHAAQRPAVAWLLPGADAAAWLDELARWGAAAAQARAVLLPASPRQAAAGACFVIAPAATSAGPLAHGYGLAAGRLYLPVEAELWPPVSVRELHELFPDEHEHYLWHPALGLMPLPAAMMVRVSELLSPPRERDTDWRRAVPGVAFQQRLRSISPDSPPDVAAMLAEGRGDIGSEELDAGALPRAPEEPGGGMLGRAGRAAGRGIARSIRWIVEHAPERGSGDGPLDRAGKWASETLERLSRQVAIERNREIARLLHLLKTNPDEGLKFALPLAGDAARGIARPGGRLARRDVNYDSRRVGYGGPVDAWELQREIEERLRTHYRELANREIALGRHRRAAYIFAELLGDFHAAASALAAGMHCREAAALYLDRLRQPLDAARCLERAGLVTEAISIYERHSHFEKAGHLYRLIEQHDQAQAAFLLAVEGFRSAGDDLAAARLLENELADPKAALDCLAGAWPGKPQAASCLAAAFELLARRAWHKQAHERVGGLAATLRSPPQYELAARQLAEVAAAYPDDDVKARAADQLRLLASGRFPLASAAEAGRIARALVRLAPQDRLLARDADRFAWLVQAQQAARPKPQPRIRGPKLLLEFSLPEAAWTTAVNAGATSFAAGYRDDEVVLVRFNFDGYSNQPVQEPWRVNPGAAGNPISLAVDGRWEPALYVHVVGHKPMPAAHRFPASNDMGTARICPHSSFALETAGFCVGVGGTFYSVTQSGHVTTLSAYRPDDSLLGTYGIGLSPTTVFEPLPMLVRDSTVFIAGGDSLVIQGPRNTTLKMPAPVTGLAASDDHTRLKLVVGMTVGAMLIWDSPETGRPDTFAEELETPAVALIRESWLVAAGAGELQVFTMRDNRLALHSQTAGTGKPPIAVLPVNRLNQFAVVDDSGKVRVYLIER